MTGYEDREGPRSNVREIHIVQKDNGRVIALTSRVSARALSSKGYRNRGAVEADSEVHIGDKIWFVLGNKRATFVSHSEASAKEYARDNDGLVAGTRVKYWNSTTGKLYTKRRLDRKEETSE